MTSDGVQQTTLEGGEAEPVECEYYDGCRSSALYIAEILHYGEGKKPVKMCESCAEEHTEADGNEFQRLKPEDRYVGEESDKPRDKTVWVVAANYADDPHPHIEAVYDNPGSAIEHKKAIRESIKASEPVAWMSSECEVKSHPVRESRSRETGGESA